MIMVYSQTQGHKIYYENNEWRYVDNNELLDLTNPRPCIKCKKYPTTDGYDACLGYIEGAKAVCCGHGIKDGYIKWSNNETK